MAPRRPAPALPGNLLEKQVLSHPRLTGESKCEAQTSVSQAFQVILMQLKFETTILYDVIVPLKLHPPLDQELGHEPYLL